MADASDLTHPLPLTRFYTYQLAQAAQAASRASQRWHQRHSGFTLAEWRVFAVLGQLGPGGVNEVADRIAMDKAAVSRAKSALVARGLLGEAADATDSRRLRLKLTARGRRLYRRILALAEVRQHALVDGIGARDLATFERVLGALHHRFDAES